MKMTVDIDEKLLREVQNRLGSFSKKAPKALYSALNRAASNVSSNISKEVRKEYIIKSADVKATISRTKATGSRLETVVRSKGNLTPLDRFKVSPKKVQPKRKKQIKIAVKKGGVKSVLGAFVTDINGIKIFQRSSKKRLPIKRLFGPSVPQMLSNEKIRDEIESQGQETFQRRLDHEIERILDKGRARSS